MAFPKNQRIPSCWRDICCENINAKTNIMKKMIFLLLCIASIGGCKKDNSFDNSSGILGNWSWLKTCVGSGTACWSPTTTHTSSRIVFTIDSVYNFYRNDTLKSSTKFHTFSSVSDDGKYTTHIIKYDSGSWGMFSITNDTLSLIDEGDITFFTSLYKRIK